MFIELNLIDEDDDVLLLASQAHIKSINICNTGSNNATISLFVKKLEAPTRFFYIREVTLLQKNTFIAEDITVAEDDSFYISVPTGSCCVIVDYT